MIHLYTGDGKGKTTAALGLALRALGSGKSVIIVQFLKGSRSSEAEVLNRTAGVTLMRNSRDYGFFSLADDNTRKLITNENNSNLNAALELLTKDKPAMLILDEAVAAYNLNAVDRETLNLLISSVPPNVELVLTGREPPPHFIEAADYVSDIRKIKHPYDRGIAAREGVEY